MSDGNRGKRDQIGLGIVLVFSAFIGGLLLDGASTQEFRYKVEAENRAADYSDAARIEAHSSCIEAEAVPLPVCVEQAEQAARPEQRQEYDLQAQRTMAVWTRAMGIAAIIGMSVGILGVGLIFITLKETRRTADEARRNADAFIASERGYLRLGLEVGSKRGEAETVHATLRATIKGRSEVEIGEIFYDSLPSPDYPMGHNWQRIVPKMRFFRPSDEPNWVNILGCDIPAQEGYFGGYVTYHTQFGERRKYFVCKIAQRESVGEGTIRFDGLPSDRAGWPEVT